MSKDTKWLAKWEAYMKFMRDNKRRPSKHIPQDRPLVNWLKHCRKLYNKGLLNDFRKQRLMQLLAEAQRYTRVNQYLYASGKPTAIVLKPRSPHSKPRLSQLPFPDLSTQKT